MYWHTNTVIFFYSENSMPFFGGKKPQAMKKS